MPVTANFHQNWIKMIQQWGEVILISYSLSEEFQTGLRIDKPESHPPNFKRVLEVQMCRRHPKSSISI